MYCHQCGVVHRDLKVCTRPPMDDECVSTAQHASLTASYWRTNDASDVANGRGHYGCLLAAAALFIAE